jgi:hypothetical protein
LPGGVTTPTASELAGHRAPAAVVAVSPVAVSPLDAAPGFVTVIVCDRVTVDVTVLGDPLPQPPASTAAPTSAASRRRRSARM